MSTRTFRSRRGVRRSNRRRAGRRSRIPRKPSPALVHYHKKTVYIRNWQTVTAATGFSINRTFQLSDLGGEALNLASLYQLFCLKAVKVDIIPQANVNQIGLSGAPNIHSVIDYQDNTAKTTAQMQEYNSYKMTRGQRTHTRYFKPRLLDTMYSGSVIGPAYISSKGPQWLMTQSNQSVAAPHYGLDVTVDPIQTGGDLTMYIDLKVTYYWAFKSQR